MFPGGCGPPRIHRWSLQLKLSVIIGVRHPESWLDKALTGFALQTWRDFEVIVAEAGPSRSVAELIAGRRHGYPVPLRHVWQEEGGRRRRGVLDRAISLAAHEYLVFTDADCIPRRDFVAAHATLAERGRFLSGSCCRLGAALSERISRNDIVRGRCFDLEWLQSHQPLSASSRRKLGAGTTAARLLDRVTPAGVTLDLRNASAWKQDLARAGADADLACVDPGVGLRLRLEAGGIRGRRIRHKAVCLQLEHPPALARVEGGAAARPLRAGDQLPSAAPWPM